ncbi:TetR/AcrR family transcriptional regulator [Microbacterium sp. NPDC055903]
MSEAGTAPVRRGPYAKTASRRAEIIASATAVFSAHGYRGGSLRQIAKALDLGLTTVMHHFPTKAALLEAVLEQEDRSDPDAEERSRRDGFIPMVLGIVERNLARRELVRMFSIVAAEATYPEHEAHAWLVGRYATVTVSYAALIEHDRAIGRIRSERPAAQLAALVLSGWEGIQIRWLADGTDPVAAMRVLMEELLLPSSAD